MVLPINGGLVSELLGANLLAAQLVQPYSGRSIYRGL
jgi:hypothetical protein